MFDQVKASSVLLMRWDFRSDHLLLLDDFLVSLRSLRPLKKAIEHILLNPVSRRAFKRRIWRVFSWAFSTLIPLQSLLSSHSWQ